MTLFPYWKLQVDEVADQLGVGRLVLTRNLASHDVHGFERCMCLDVDSMDDTERALKDVSLRYAHFKGTSTYRHRHEAPRRDQG